MAENAPPGGANAASDAASRGMPYYERLRRDLRESLQKKRVLDNNLQQLEDNILRVETQYLEETSAGNIIKGFDNYIKGAATTTTTSGAGTATRRKAQVSDVDRIFSRSSSSFLREASTPASAGTTPSHAATPISSFPTRESSQPTANGARGGSKKKKAGDDDDADSASVKRNKISYGRE
ncbi:histone acetyltransferase subunit NuA4-domain-containing protein [Boeremia exigua]|uniref:histone acetyltransferase subunit NuA4-domain-containing protein n=1 Tax=Boeremia exigua TaxID=749465 RepID=UPI001E8DFCE5|nr:histone acetyltransferase subunit NuA4-domain-containing protein [Boeremia exigua]KAH6638290.1 histone acetyltransferase subunit NuA4-domain-containing protein [Boeremia exigua]